MIDNEKVVADGNAEFSNVPELEQELPRSPEELWQDPNVISYSFRRHGNYERTQGSKMRGALTAEGIDETNKQVEQWHEQLPEDAEVSIYQSPSYIADVREVVDPKTNEVRLVRPKRATITASRYEQAVYGNQQPGALEDDGYIARNAEGEPVSGRRVTEPILGDFFETATSGEAVGKFYNILNDPANNFEEIYNGPRMSPDFWRHYVADTLDPRLANAIQAAGGADSIQLASNILTFINRTDSDLEQKIADPENPSKEVVVAVSHGETIESFVHYAMQYLEQQGATDELEAFRALDPDLVSYNEGVDVHVSGDTLTVVATKDGHTAQVEVTLDGFKSYLDGLRKQKELSRAGEAL